MLQATVVPMTNGNVSVVVTSDDPNIPDMTLKFEEAGYGIELSCTSNPSSRRPNLSFLSSMSPENQDLRTVIAASLSSREELMVNVMASTGLGPKHVVQTFSESNIDQFYRMDPLAREPGEVPDTPEVSIPVVTEEDRDLAGIFDEEFGNP